MNIWTHVIGASLFIFLIYLTYAIPVENIFTLRQDMNDLTVQYQCNSRNYSDLISDELLSNGTCTESYSRDLVLADEFSTLYYYLSSTNKTYSLELSDDFFSFFSWFSSNTSSITHEVVDGIFQSMHSIYHWLTTSSNAIAVRDEEAIHMNSTNEGFFSKVREIVEQLFNDLTEFDHKVVGHVPRWPIIVFTCCAIWCLAGSAIYHHFYCCNYLLSNILQTLDYCGISILISGSYVPVIYYAFYCYPGALKFHLITIVLLNVINVSVMATPTFRYSFSI